MKGKYTRDEAIAVIERYADDLIKFHETSYGAVAPGYPLGYMMVSFVIPGKFGIADDFWDAMRALRKAPPPPDHVLYPWLAQPRSEQI